MRIRKRIFHFSFLFLVFCISVSAQPLVINWQSCFGGSEYDEGIKILKENNGYLLFSDTYSIDGQVTGNHGETDIWVVRTDTVGNVQWSKTYGGSDYDYLTQAMPLSDGSFIMAGYSLSNNGTVSGNHGGSDYWVVKIDSLGTIIWQKCHGGSANDNCEAMDMTSDSGFICNGWSYSNDGDVSGNHGLYDFWVARLFKNGNLKWENSFGGTWADYGEAVVSTGDGGSILAGGSGSTDGDVLCTYHGGVNDFWVVKLDSLGSLEWQQCYGGSQHDFANLVQPLPAGGYLIAGNTQSNDLQVSGNHGMQDFWVIRIDQSGVLLNQKCFGGSNDESPHVLKALSDGNFLIAGRTLSNDGDVSGNHGWGDIWIIKISPDLDLLWQQCVGGEGDENISDLIEINPGQYVAIGSTSSTLFSSGNVRCSGWGVQDVWVFSLTDSTVVGTTNKTIEPKILSVYPDPADDEVSFEYKLPGILPGTFLEIFTETGKCIESIPINERSGKVTLNSSRIPSGLYFYMLNFPGNPASGKFVIMH